MPTRRHPQKMLPCGHWSLSLVVVIGCCCWLLLLVVIVGCPCWLLLSVLVDDRRGWLSSSLIGCWSSSLVVVVGPCPRSSLSVVVLGCHCQSLSWVVVIVCCCPHHRLCPTGEKKYHCVIFVYTMLRCQEGKIKKSANEAALPGGGGMPLRWQII